MNNNNNHMFVVLWEKVFVEWRMYLYSNFFLYCDGQLYRNKGEVFLLGDRLLSKDLVCLRLRSTRKRGDVICRVMEIGKRERDEEREG